tara:strand:+ start:88 stop:561 length:474 start_codon:yes stop_codon:yes gene_type:complete
MKNVKVGLLFLVIIAFSTQLYSQQNPREERPFGLSFYGGGPSLFASVSADYFVSNKVSFEAGGGLFGVHAGGRIHSKGELSDRRWTFNSGLLFAFYGETVGTDHLTFIPLGYQFIGEQGFNFAIEGLIIGDVLAGLILQQGLAFIPVWPGIKFGYRF